MPRTFIDGTMTAPHARRVALNVAGAALLLAGGKAAVGVATGSIAVLSSALDSAGDALASFANFVFLTIASKPPDEEHPFGHGKAEHLAALLQGVILLGGAIILGIRAAERIRHPVAIESSLSALLTMIASIVATIAVTRYLKRNAVRNEVGARGRCAALHVRRRREPGHDRGAGARAADRQSLFDSIFGVTVACWIAWNSLYLLWNAATT